MSDALLFEDTFRIASLNSAKYDRVSRLVGTSATDPALSMTLDINSELYPVSVGESLTIVLANSLSMDGSKDEDGRTWRDLQRSGESTLADLYDYVCRGKLYRMGEGGGATGEGEGAEEGSLRVYISFGGLLLFLEGPYRRLAGLKIEHVYMLCKK